MIELAIYRQLTELNILTTNARTAVGKMRRNQPTFILSAIVPPNTPPVSGAALLPLDQIVPPPSAIQIGSQRAKLDPFCFDEFRHQRMLPRRS